MQCFNDGLFHDLLLFLIFIISEFCLCSSMYLDEDGVSAHEFYEEIKPPHRRGKGKPFMRRVLDGLVPEVNLGFIVW